MDSERELPDIRAYRNIYLGFAQEEILKDLTEDYGDPENPS